jgi:hypothetical protein
VFLSRLIVFFSLTGRRRLLLIDRTYRTPHRNTSELKETSPFRRFLPLPDAFSFIDERATPFDILSTHSDAGRIRPVRHAAGLPHEVLLIVCFSTFSLRRCVPPPRHNPQFETPHATVL